MRRRITRQHRRCGGRHGRLRASAANGRPGPCPHRRRILGCPGGGRRPGPERRWRRFGHQIAKRLDRRITTILIGRELGLDPGDRLRVQSFAVRLDRDGRLLVVGRIAILPALE
jgi:hypothetical protein